MDNIHKYKSCICKKNSPAKRVTKIQNRIKKQYDKWLPDFELISGSEKLTNDEINCYYEFLFKTELDLEEYLAEINNGKKKKAGKKKNKKAKG